MPVISKSLSGILNPFVHGDEFLKDGVFGPERSDRGGLFEDLERVSELAQEEGGLDAASASAYDEVVDEIGAFDISPG